MESILELVADDVLNDEQAVKDDDSRFGTISDAELLYLTQKQYSVNTARKIITATNLLSSWVRETNNRLRLSSMRVPTKSVDQWNVEELNKWIPRFICEVRTVEGKRYRSKTLMEYIICLQCSWCKYLLKDDQFAAIQNSKCYARRAKRRSWVSNKIFVSQYLSMT